MEVSAVIVGAGKGKRMGGVSKAFLILNGEPIINYSIRVLLEVPFIKEIIVVLSKGDIKRKEKLISDKKIRYIEGGTERSLSVKNGVLEAKYPFVLIHDAVRPIISKEFVEEIINSLEDGFKGVIPGVREKNTVKFVNKNLVEKTILREGLYEIQTPQFFERKVLKEAYNKLNIDEATDESYLVELLGHKVKFVLGKEENIKITTPFDLFIAEQVIKKCQ